MRAPRGAAAVLLALGCFSSAWGSREFPGGLNMSLASPLGAVGEELTLCDCERASGDPHGLSCDKEGFFIAGFERTGSWVGGAGEVPLSHAICCRPCLPKLPVPGAKPGDVPETIVSVNCAPAPGKKGQENRCPLSTQTFVTGFESAVTVESSADPAAYPVGPAQCCEPALLMKSGDMFMVERCNCVYPPEGVSCGTPPTATNRLLQGFVRSKTNHLALGTKDVPMAPAECCKACLSPMTPKQDCAALKHCSGHGICAFGQCQCVGGYTGVMCESSPGGGGIWGMSVPVFIQVLLMCVLSCACLKLCLCGLGTPGGGRGPRSDFSGEQMEEPLLRGEQESDYWDTETDTETESEEESPDDAEEARLRAAASARRRAAQEREAALAAREEREEGDGEGEGADAEAEAEHDSSPAAEGGEDAAEPDGEADGEAEAEAEVDGGEEEEEACVSEAAAAEAEAPAPRPRQRSSTAGMECVICMSAPIKVVAIPCGHASMCRKCSKRLRRCPICRTPIAHRQKLFIESHGLNCD